MNILDVKYLRKPEEVHGYIYGFKSPSGKWYIGQTKNESLFRYLQISYVSQKAKYRAKFQNAIKKYGLDSFQFYVLDIAPDSESLNELEKEYIKFYNSVENGYNCTYGGDKWELSEESKLKMSNSHTGVKFSQERRSKMKMVQVKNASLRYKYLYKIKSPEGEEIETKSLRDFCIKNKINRANLVTYGKHKGWIFIAKELLNAA
jgi:group I intron endonuclease